MRLLLDTVAFLLAAESPTRLTKRASDIFADSGNILELSSVSVSEIAINASLGKLRFSAEDTLHAIEDLDLRVVPYTLDHALRLFDLPVHHRDPFDRQLIAQALCENIPVITSDQKFSLYKGVEIIW